MNWLPPKDEHVVYEAISAIADGRFEMLGENSAKSTSTSGGKFYSIDYDSSTQSIMSDDNMAFYTDTISYLMIAFLMKKEIVKYDKSLHEPLSGLKWKDINKKNKNDYMKSVREVLEMLGNKGFDKNHIENECYRIFKVICELKLSYLGTKKAPPKAY